MCRVVWVPVILAVELECVLRLEEEFRAVKACVVRELEGDVNFRERPKECPGP